MPFDQANSYTKKKEQPANTNGSNYVQKDSPYQTEEDKQLQIVLNSFAYSRSFYSFRQLKFRQWLRLFHRIPDQKAAFRSNLFIPMAFQLVETILPRMIANDPSFRFEPRRQEDSENNEAVEQMSSLIKYQLKRADFFKKLTMWAKDTLMFGTGILKIWWERNDAKEINDPSVEVVDLLDFYPDPKAVSIEGGDFMIHRSIVPLTMLKKAVDSSGKKVYHNLDAIKENSNEEASNKIFMTNDRSMTVGDIDARLVLGTPYRQSVTRQVEVMEYWGIYGEEDEEWIITVANRNKVIRAEKNMYPNGQRPFIKMEIDPNNFLFYGTGIIDPIEGLQNAQNDVRNLRIDNANLINNKTFLVLKDADVNETELVSRPGGVIYQGVPGGVSILETPDIMQSAYQEEAMIKQDAQETVGISDIINGQLQDTNGDRTDTLNRTAKGAQIAVEQAGSRFKYYLGNMEDALKELGKRMYEYNQEFLSEERVIRVEAPTDYEQLQKQTILKKIKSFIGLQQQQLPKFQWIKVRPDAIKNLELDVSVESGSTQPVEETLKQQKFINLMSLIGQLPVTTPETWMVMAEEALKTFSVQNADKILKTFQMPQPTGPKTSVSVSLKGDLNPLQTADIAKQAGATPQSTDPNLISGLMAQDRHDDIMDKLIDHASTLNESILKGASKPTGPPPTNNPTG